MPYISQIAVGKLEQLSIFGNDYLTVDGTGVRDFIYVTGLARGHVAVRNYLEQQTSSEKSCLDTASTNQTSSKSSSIGSLPINLGTGKRTSVLELVFAFFGISGRAIPYQFTSRRTGNIASYYVSADKAKSLLDWEAKLFITDMC